MNEWSGASAIDLAKKYLAETNRGNLDVRLIRLGTNGVVSAGDQLILRVAPTDYSDELLEQQLELTKWLVDTGFPTNRPLIDRAVTVDGHAITEWQFLGDPNPVPVRYESFGAIAREYHQITDAYVGSMPTWDPLGRMGDRLVTVQSDTAFTESDRTVLIAAAETLVAQSREAEFLLPPGPIHGDLHTGNLIEDAGTLFLVDFDRIARGPREWDVAQIFASIARFGGDEAKLDQFAKGYGWDMREWKYLDVFVGLRSMFMTTWLLTLPRTDSVTTEIGNRMSYWRAPESYKGRWEPV